MKVTLYSMPRCQGCRLTKMKLDECDIPYREVRIDQDPEAFAYVQALGYAAAPVVEVDFGEGAELHWSGYRPDHVTRLVEN